MMKILIADDDRVTSRMLEAALTEWGYETVTVTDGIAAWDILQGQDPPPLALLDWLMPGIDGLEICRHVRAVPREQPTFLILLTARDSREDLVAGLRGGADEYITKPFDLDELHARIHTGLRLVELQRTLADRVRQLQEALARVKQLQGLLPICCYCKNIRVDQNYWQQLEAYLTAHADLHFSHGICPRCFQSIVEPELLKFSDQDISAALAPDC
jgi:DNA-binding response OmpR family regulator